MKIIYLLSAISLFSTLSLYGQKTKASAQPAFEHLIEYPNIRDFTLSADGNEAYFTVQSPLGEISVIAKMEKKDGKWQNPEIVSFSGKHKDLEAFLTPDGLRVYFASDRPLGNEDKEKDFNIWYAGRNNVKEEWQPPKPLDTIINGPHNEFYPSLARNGNLYFTSDRPGGKGKDDIYFSKWDGETFYAPQSLDFSINSQGYEFNAYISPDESFLLFTGYNREGGFGSGDLYISYQNEEGNWGEASNLGANINSKYMDYCPFADLATKTLYFTTRRSNVEITAIKTMDDFLKETRQYENGWSRIYRVPFLKSLDK
jgi:hypothetical protein